MSISSIMKKWLRNVKDVLPLAREWWVVIKLLFVAGMFILILNGGLIVSAKISDFQEKIKQKN